MNKNIGTTILLLATSLRLGICLSNPDRSSQQALCIDITTLLRAIFRYFVFGECRPDRRHRPHLLQHLRRRPRDGGTRGSHAVSRAEADKNAPQSISRSEYQSARHRPGGGNHALGVVYSGDMKRSPATASMGPATTTIRGSGWLASSRPAPPTATLHALARDLPTRSIRYMYRRGLMHQRQGLSPIDHTAMARHVICTTTSRCRNDGDTRPTPARIACVMPHAEDNLSNAIATFSAYPFDFDGSSRRFVVVPIGEASE